MKRKEIAIIALIGAYFVGSEVYYARSIQPEGVRTAADHLARFGPPLSVIRFECAEQTFFRVSGKPPRWWVMAVPSSVAAYIYDDKGSLVDWCPAPGDQPSFDKRWPRINPENVTLEEFANHFRAR